MVWHGVAAATVNLFTSIQLSLTIHWCFQYSLIWSQDVIVGLSLVQVNNLILENLISTQSNPKRCYVAHECLFFAFGHWEINLNSQHNRETAPAWPVCCVVWQQFMNWEVFFEDAWVPLAILFHNKGDDNKMVTEMIANHFNYIPVSLPWFHSQSAAQWWLLIWRLRFSTFSLALFTLVPNLTIRGFKSTHSSLLQSAW